MVMAKICVVCGRKTSSPQMCRRCEKSSWAALDRGVSIFVWASTRAAHFARRATKQETERELTRTYGYLQEWQRWATAILEAHGLGLPDGWWGDHSSRDVLGVALATGLRKGNPARKAAERYVLTQRAVTAKVVKKARAKPARRSRAK